jgi:hypothetical protein
MAHGQKKDLSTEQLEQLKIHRISQMLKMELSQRWTSIRLSRLYTLKEQFFFKKMTNGMNLMGDTMDSGIVSLQVGTHSACQSVSHHDSFSNISVFAAFLDAIDGSYCTYSAFGETGDCTDPDCLDPVYPDPNPGGYKGQLQCGVYKPTNVISISYHQVEGELPDSYFKRQCNEWLKLALQGTTIVTSSGDVGVGQKSQCGGDDEQIFSPHSAASCPYVLAVGSTQWDRFANATGPELPYEKLNEVATTRFASGGGFSQIFGTPSYQQQAVEAYFAQVNSTLPFDGYDNFVIDGNYSSVTSGVYHRGGRGYPDVAAVGDRQVVFTRGKWQLIGGTSLSSPVFASVLTLINEERLKAGKSTLGYLHPVLVCLNHSIPVSLTRWIVYNILYSMQTLKSSTMSQLVITQDATILQVSQRPLDGTPFQA